jgi:acetoin utilization protein AcuC
VLGQPALAAVHTYDGSFIECFEAVVPEALRAFGPDLIFSQNGCDAHALDPLGD